MADQKSIRPQILKLLEEFEDLSPVMEEIGEQIVSSMIENFRVGGRYGTDNEFGGGSQSWTPSKAALDRHGQTLVESSQGGLRGSIVADVDGNTVTVGTNKVYGAIHNFGGETGRNKATKLPARPWAVVQDADLEDIEDIITAHYSALLHAA